MSDDVAALRKRLAEAEKLAAQERREKFLKPFLGLEGRAFYYRNVSVTGKKKEMFACCGFILYGRAHMARHSDSGDMWAVLPRKTVFVTIPNSSSPGAMMTGATIRSCHSPYENVRNFDDEVKSHVSEVPVTLFNKVFAQTKAVSENVASMWTGLLGVEHPLDADYCIEVPSGELDLPHIILEGMEQNLLGQPVYLVDSTRYLVSPESIKWARQKLLEEEEAEGRVSHLLQACDMGYVQRKSEAIRSIRAKLGIQ